MNYIITESQVDTMKKYMFDILDKDSNSWNVEHFKFREMMISDESGDVLFNYSTNNENYGEMSDFLSISPKLIRKVEAFLPLMDEYYISEWFSQKYNRRVDEVMIEDEEMDEFFQESEVQRLEGEVFELESQLIEHRDKERIYQDILTDINNSLIDLFKREEENNRFNFGEVTDYRQCMVGMKEYLDNIKSVYKGKIKF